MTKLWQDRRQQGPPVSRAGLLSRSYSTHDPGHDAMHLPNSWSVLKPETHKKYFHDLRSFLESERRKFVVYPPEHEVFAALEHTPFEQVRVLILGQDPYHEEGQAHGLCFSVQPGVRIPPSLKNIFRERRDDLKLNDPPHGCLVAWAEQGVLMLNTVLTVRRGAPHSHRGHGWEQLTDAAIGCINAKPRPVVFVLWGKPAQTKKKLIDSSRHVIIESSHPSPLSAHRGFFGSRPFSRINAALRETGQPTIDWKQPAHT